MNLALVHEPPRTDTCEKHGDFESKNLLGRIWSRCPGCQAEEKAEEEKKKEERRREAEQLAILREQEKIRAMIQRSGIPERFQYRTLENYKAATDAQKKALQFSCDYVKNFEEIYETGRSAIFCGQPGTGKTHLAAAIGLKLLRDHSASVIFITVMRAIRLVKSTWSKNSEMSETDAIQSLVNPTLLILDEVGMQFGSDTEKLILFDIINERYENRLPTLLLSNCTAQEIKTYLGDRTFDRLREDGGQCIVFDWESYRGQATYSA